MLTPVHEEDDLELEPEEQDLPNELKRSHAVIDLCDDEDPDELAGLMGCPMCYEIIDHFHSYLEEFQARLVCTERYSEFELPVGGREPGPRGVLRDDQHRSRPTRADRGVQSVRELPGQPKAKNPKTQKGK